MRKVYGLLLMIMLMFPLLAYSSEINFNQAKQVADNYLEYILVQDGEWADCQQAAIVDFQPVEYADVLLGYNFVVSPIGHILVPNRDDFSPVLLYSDSSSFNPERITEPESMESWIIPEMYKIYRFLSDNRSALEKNIRYEDSRVAKAWDWLQKDDEAFLKSRRMRADKAVTVGPLLSTTWGQGSPYNDYTPSGAFCSHTYVGCVPLAWGQLMRYWAWPSQGIGSNSYTWKGSTLSANFDHFYYWSDMPDSLHASSSSEEIDATARLVSDLGIAAETDYSCYGSGSSMYADQVLDNNFKYKDSMSRLDRSDYTSSSWFNVIQGELNATDPRPIVLSIWDTNYGGHETIIDGYQTGATDKVHINYGWDGSYDGFYDVTSNWTTGGSTWKYTSQIIVTGIEPDGYRMLSPLNGETLSSSQTFQWDTGACRYYLYVGSSKGACDYYDSGYIPGSVSSKSVTGLPTDGSDIYVRLWFEENAFSGWDYEDYVYLAPSASSPPQATTLISPSGSIADTSPSFTWNAVSDATWYRLYVREGVSGSVHDQWYKASSVTSGSTCSVTPNVTLVSGEHTWWVQTWNQYGYGPWSSGMSFSVNGGSAPGAATLISPSGSIADTSPSFTWNAVSDATWYGLYVREGVSGSVHDQWYKASSVTSGSTCSVTPSITLGSGGHIWWVQAWNQYGYGLWSSGMTFHVSGSVAGAEPLTWFLH